MNDHPRTVMLTGAAGNLGRALASAFAAQGDRLVLLGRTVESLQQVFGDAGEHRLFVALDLQKQDQVAQALAAASARFGRVEVLCNLAGGFQTGLGVHETPTAVWDFLQALNVTTLLNAVRVLVPHMLAHGGGKVVNIGAFAAQKGTAHLGAYAAAKSSVIRLTESMAAELRDKNINVNCVLPTILDTPENRRALPQADPARWVAPQDLAHVIVFLASEAARALHGAQVPVTGLS